MSLVHSTTNTVSSNVFHRRLNHEPLYAVRAEGNYIYTKDGRKLLDGGVGSGVTTIGYGNKRVAEVVGSTSGCTPAVPGYFNAMREVCDRYGVLFVLDEIMCGIGRTGKMHAWQWENLSSPPDIQVNGKGLAGGYAPIGAVLVSAKVVDTLSAGSGEFNNIYSYQLHPVACRATLEVLKVIKEDALVEQCHQRGIFLEKLLKTQLGDHPHIGDIRLANIILF
ncbi:unnamed protein product [Rotaria sp. Silwood2]|nr:unnamed protein product [Rotaria sp. Silwood2]CAF3129046.1 unnamed protein product [Rotaria sp. Silwood2]CAF3432316.1 unnamed protein product [Rotaria sp. Silwood2]CAF4450858.1 unnamed protein product [Rotaria sp. Silwood2]CAF4513665.1 unnamed protein product [Rotaria sp. Silwood2]